MRNLMLIAALAVCSGCAYTPMTVNLEPDTNVTASDIGGGQTIYLRVVDERTSQDIGNRGSAMIKGAKISLEEDLAAIVQTALSDMFARKGFVTALDGSSNSQPLLRVDVRGLDASASTGFWTGGVEVNAAIRAEANGEFENYENFYRYSNEDRVVVVPGAEGNNERINAALNDVLHQLMRDRKLLEVLAGK